MEQVNPCVSLGIISGLMHETKEVKDGTGVFNPLVERIPIVRELPHDWLHVSFQVGQNPLGGLSIVQVVNEALNVVHLFSKWLGL